MSIDLYSFQLRKTSNLTWDKERSTYERRTDGGNGATNGGRENEVCNNGDPGNTALEIQLNGI